MLIYTFEKSFLDRMDEIKIVIDAEDDSMKSKWKEFLETSIEPAGYGAIWKISRASCEDLNINYPSEVYGIVENTIFDDLFAVFSVVSVHNESIHLPEVCQVPLEDLYPTIEQENSALNVDLTADCLDRYRFFFKYIFLPWDEDIDADFAQKLLEPRMQLFFDLKNKKISKALSSHIRGIINEAKYIQQSRENLENSFEDSSDDIDISYGESKEKARKLLQLHFRMNQIKHDIDIISNPEMRVIYEEVKFPNHQFRDKKIFVISKPGRFIEHAQMVEQLRGKVDDSQTVHWTSLQAAIATSSAKSEIYIPSGEHELNFLEYLNGDILLSGISPISIYNIDMEQLHRYTKLTPIDTGLFLFAVDGDLRFENLIIDCEKVKTGVLINDGQVSLKNCLIYGSKESSVSEAFNITGNVKVLIENCIIMNFATAITVHGSAEVEIRHSVIKNCNHGIQLLADESKLSIEKTSILNCDFGILKHSEGDDGKTLDWDDKKGAEM